MPEIGLSGLMLDYPYSGTATYGRNLVRHLPNVAPEFDFRLFLRNAPAPETAVAAFRLTTPLARFNHGAGAGARLDKLAWEIGSLPLASARHKQVLLHSLYFSAPLVAAVPVIVTIHDVIPSVISGYHRGRASALYARLMSHAVKRAAAVITVSEHARTDIIRTLGISPDQVFVTPEAADERFRPSSPAGERDLLSERYGLPERFVLYLGGAEHRKNLPTLVRAWSLVGRQMSDREVSLVIVADFPPPDALYPDILGLTASLPNTDRIRVIPSVSEADKPGVYRQALAFCFPSTYEGFGLPPLEAMASGVPVVASNATSLPEVVGDAGILLDPLDVRVWADTLVRLVDSPADRAECGTRGLERAALFSWSHTAELTAKVYRQVLSR